MRGSARGSTPRLTRQQAHVLREFAPADMPHTQTSETLAFCGVREWPTCANLVRFGLIRRVEWLIDEGWHYEITDDGCDVLRAMEGY